MAARIDRREEIAKALKALESEQYAATSRRFFATLGYESNRRVRISTPQQFCEQLDPQGKLTDRERAAIDQLRSLHLLFQLTGAELAAHADMFDDAGAVQVTQIESYLFFAAELASGQYTRTALSTLVRAVNKPLPMPAVVLFRHGNAVSLGIIHRRLHKRDQGRDVLEKVTLIKDIALGDPIRAHLEILNDFAFGNLDADFGIANFVGLHEAWQKRLGSYALSNDFYREIADWYFWAHHQVEDGSIHLPQHCDTEQERALFLIRLLTRVVFCWFLVEKRLIPTDLFREHRLKELLEDFKPSKDPKKPDSASSYYRAILQNLFFGTLNMPLAQRTFREKKKEGERYDKNYGISNLWRYESEFRNPGGWIAIAKRIPFLNGGLFDCLDEKTGKREENSILDGFSDNPKLSCHLPNDLFFGPDRTMDLSRDYGEEDKRTARSKKAKVRGLIEILSRYKFTIEENTPLEEEIALDPELLGKVFENLLASYNEDTRTTARKALGAFYTPREIVSYMVDEALKSYLVSQVPRCKGVLDDLFSNKATPRDTATDTREGLISAIGRVKILDPACGSGAFPMGALHRLVDLLQKLDPNNESWKRDRLAEAQQHRRALEEQGAVKEEISAADARIADIEKSFDTRVHDLDFARKLYLIENCIYGVDILPIATQIAKLRFFISLIVDQKIDPQAENLGVRPLPNLETRIVAADVLIPIEKERGDLFSGDVDRLRAELAEIRHEHFNARTAGAKRKWRDADEGKRREIAELLERNHSVTRHAAAKLATWDPYDQNSFAPFFDSEWMFDLPVDKDRSHGDGALAGVGDLKTPKNGRGQTKFASSSANGAGTGFDIVIGNPPYVRQEQITHLKPTFEQLYVSFDGRADLFVYFYEAAVRLLKQGAVLAYISSNKWLRAKYGRALRGFLAGECAPRILIDFGELPVFSAATFPMVFVGVRGIHGTCTFVQVPSLTDPYPDVGRVVSKYGIPLTTEQLRSEIWTFTTGLESQVLDSIAKAPNRVPASQIMAGIKTGLNEAFWLDSPTRQELLRQDKAIGEFIKPLLVGDDIRRFRTKPVSKWIIYTPIGTDPKRLGPLKNHLVKWKARLERRALDQAWYELQQAQQRYCEYFEHPKIVYPDIAMEPRFTIDSSGRYLDMTAFAISSADKALLGVLNSQVAWFFLKRTAAVLGDADKRGRLRLKRQYIERLPLPDLHKEQSSPVANLVDALMFMNEYLSAYEGTSSVRIPLMMAYWDRVVNGLVYELYFREEIHAVGLRLFEIVNRSQIKELPAVPKASVLKYLAEKFEEIYDPEHPLRIALDKLQTLDLVRIIEGKS